MQLMILLDNVDKLFVTKILTERIILLIIENIFDHLKSWSPIILCAKLITQKIQEIKAGWDEEVLDKVKKIWSEFMKLLRNLTFCRQGFLLQDIYTNLSVHRKMTPFSSCNAYLFKTFLMFIFHLYILSTSKLKYFHE